MCSTFSLCPITACVTSCLLPLLHALSSQTQRDPVSTKGRSRCPRPKASSGFSLRKSQILGMVLGPYVIPPSLTHMHPANLLISHLPYSQPTIPLLQPPGLSATSGAAPRLLPLPGHSTSDRYVVPSLTSSGDWFKSEVPSTLLKIVISLLLS